MDIGKLRINANYMVQFGNYESVGTVVRILNTGKIHVLSELGITVHLPVDILYEVRVVTKFERVEE